MCGINRGTSTAGFTLIEAMLVVAVTGLLLTGVAPFVESHRERRSFIEAETLVDEGVSLARSRAVQSGIPHTIVFEPRLISVKGNGVSWAKRLPKSVSLSIVTAQEVQVGGYPALAFFGDGTSSGASIQLKHGSYEATRTIPWIGTGRREG